MTKEELSKELEKLEPIETLELIVQTLKRIYPDAEFQIQGYHIPKIREITVIHQ